MAAKKKPAPKRGASRYQAPAKKPVPGWVWLACGLVIGGFMVFLFSLEPGRDDVKRSKPDERRPTSTSSEEQKKPQTTTGPVKPKYDFYTLLPESEVIVPPWGQPSTVTVIWPPRAMTLGSATMLLGWLWSPPAVAAGAASPRTATAAPAAARARVLRM